MQERTLPSKMPRNPPKSDLKFQFLVVAGPVQHFQRVGQQMSDYIQRFDRAFRAAWQIQDNGAASRRHNAAGQ